MTAPRRTGGSRLRLAALAALLAAPACKGGEAAGPRVGAPAPAFTAATLQGDSVSIASLKGQVVLVNLWATWCAPCRHETPYLESLSRQHADDGLAVVGISMDTGDARDQVEEFVNEFGVTYRILVDPLMRGMDVWHVLGLPASFLIDRDGTLRWMRFGPVSADDEEFTRALGTLLR
jgi:cytochrome c biogenesis protein CcmG/thiol:disulfide interchange protein DsbE